MWRYRKSRGNAWIIQTDIQAIIRKLLRRKDSKSKLIGTSPNSKIRLFKCRFSSEKIAVQNLRKLSGQKIIFNAADEVYEAQLPMNLTSKIRKEVK